MMGRLTDGHYIVQGGPKTNNTKTFVSYIRCIQYVSITRFRSEMKVRPIIIVQGAPK